MKKFGRFEFKAEQPAEVYEGDYMTLERGYVRIFEGSPFRPDLTVPTLLAAIHLGDGQSVREIKGEDKGAKRAKKPADKPLKIATGRKFR